MVQQFSAAPSEDVGPAANDGTGVAGDGSRDLPMVAIVGRPNVGKSSLFNRLLERERAIVTATPGTTRDTLEETIVLDGIPVRLIDTAGLRDTADPIEVEGMTYTRSVTYRDAAGNTLDAYDSTTTASIEYVIGVTGEKERRGWSAAIDRTRTLIVSGLLAAWVAFENPTP